MKIGSGGRVLMGRAARPGRIGAASPILSMARGTREAPTSVLRARKGESSEKSALCLDPIRGGAAMEVLHQRCCGLDVHKKTVVACVLLPGPEGNVVKEFRTFRTMTRDLEELAQWLSELGCSQVAMEAGPGRR
jgi:hypothetical protein